MPRLCHQVLGSFKSHPGVIEFVDRKSDCHFERVSMSFPPVPAPSPWEILIVLHWESLRFGQHLEEKFSATSWDPWEMNLAVLRYSKISTIFNSKVVVCIGPFQWQWRWDVGCSAQLIWRHLHLRGCCTRPQWKLLGGWWPAGSGA